MSSQRRSQPDFELEGKKTDSSDHGLNSVSHDESTAPDRGILAYDRERLRARVALRTGSPKPSARLSLRVVDSKTSSTLPPNIKRPRLSGTLPRTSTVKQSSLKLTSSTRASILPQSSLRTKSPIRQPPWGAPTIRTPAYHEEKPLKRKSISNITQEATKLQPSPSLPKRQCTIRYAIAELLALRPAFYHVPGRLRHAEIPSSRGSEQTVVHHEPIQALTHATGVYGQHFPVLPGDKLISINGNMHAASSTNLTSMAPLMYNLPSIFASEGWYVDSVQNDHTQTQSLDSPTKKRNKDCSSEDQAASVEDLESRIRSALSNRGRRRSILGTSRNLRSVRWDPSILKEGSENSPLPSSDVLHNVDEDAKHTSQGPPKDVESSTELGAKPTNTKRKKQRREFYEYMKSITELKKGDRKKLQQLLEALTNVDTDESSNSESDRERTPRKAIRVSRKTLDTKLNPAALPFRKIYSSFPDYTSTDVSKVQAVSSQGATTSLHNAENQNPHSPLWVKATDFVPTTAQQDTGLRNKTRRSASPHAELSKTGRATISHKNKHKPTFLSHPPMPFMVLPLPPSSPLSLEREFNIYIPNENDHGREAQAVQWGSSILEKFMEKYPLTGQVQAPSLKAARNTYAANIQQRLEYLLMEQKERKAAGESLLERGGNVQLPDTSFHHMEKQLLKKLKSEIRKDEMERKSREILPLAPGLKFILNTIRNPVVERVSEASTCVDSAHSTEYAEGEIGRFS